MALFDRKISMQDFFLFMSVYYGVTSARGVRTLVTADRDKMEFRLFNSSSIFDITLRRIILLTEAKLNHTLSWFHGASHLSQVPWREVELPSLFPW